MDIHGAFRVDARLVPGDGAGCTACFCTRPILWRMIHRSRRSFPHLYWAIRRFVDPAPREFQQSGRPQDVWRVEDCHWLWRFPSVGFVVTNGRLGGGEPACGTTCQEGTRQSLVDTDLVVVLDQGIGRMLSSLIHTIIIRDCPHPVLCLRRPCVCASF